MQNDFLTKLKITCIRIISFSQKNNFQSINEYYPLVSNFRIKQNFDRTKLRIIRITRFLPAVNPSIIVCVLSRSFASAKIPPLERLSNREREKVRERESSKGEAADSRRVWGWNEETAGKKGPGTEVYGGGRAKGQGVGETKRPGKKGVAFLNPGHGTLAASLGVNVLR